MELTIADGVVLLVVLVSAMLAYSRGLTREALAIGGWLAAGLVAFYFAPMVAPLVLEIPYLGEALSSSCTLTILASFALVFGAALIVISIFTPILSSAVQSTVLGPVDHGLGFVFGVARGVLLVGVLYLGYDLIVPADDRIAAIDESASHALLKEIAATITDRAPTEAPNWLQARIDNLMGDCGGDPVDNARLLAAQPVA